MKLKGFIAVVGVLVGAGNANAAAPVLNCKATQESNSTTMQERVLSEKQEVLVDNEMSFGHSEQVFESGVVVSGPPIIESSFVTMPAALRSMTDLHVFVVRSGSKYEIEASIALRGPEIDPYFHSSIQMTVSAGDEFKLTLLSAGLEKPILNVDGDQILVSSVICKITE